ncbi:MAG: class I SAM-dependent methyltransferase, partial [Candidatus Binatia bacterium]
MWRLAGVGGGERGSPMPQPTSASDQRPEIERAFGLPAPVGVPVQFEAIVDEIARFTDLPRDAVVARVWAEALEDGWNVSRDVERFGGTPHHYDERLARVYREGDGFIFETLVFWATRARQRWSALAADRLAVHAARHGRVERDLRILMLGDGAGNDSLYLTGRGYRVEYFDQPGSRTFEFARRRFAASGLLGDRVRLVESYGAIPRSAYDAVLSFEVLEHLPDPLGAMRDIAAFLKPGGIALVTEAFMHVTAALPTHLDANRRFAGRTPFLFLAHGLTLTWYGIAPR